MYDFNFKRDETGIVVYFFNIDIIEILRARKMESCITFFIWIKQ